MRRTAAVLLLLAALALMALGLMADIRAASWSILGTALAAIVVFVDVDKLIGRG